MERSSWWQSTAKALSAISGIPIPAAGKVRSCFPARPREPSLIRSCFTRPSGLEVIVPRCDGGLAHFWRPSDATEPWQEAARPAADGNWSGVAVIHSSYGSLEIAGVCDGELRHHWQAGAGGAWSAPARIGNRMFYGRPALIQSSFGMIGNLEVVAPLFSGGLAHYWRNNDLPNLPWSDSAVYGRTVDGAQQFYDDVTLLQSASGRLEVVAALSVGGALRRFRGLPWEGPVNLVFPKGEWV